MSDEESDEDGSGHIIRIMQPNWRSDELNQFLRGLDRNIHTPHSRSVAKEIEGRTEVLCLPTSCYSDEWLSALP